MILIDTTVWIDYLNGRNTPGSRIMQEIVSNNEGIVTTPIIITEILQGIRDTLQFTQVRNRLL
ncbi:MAG: hypothetical protein WCQ50_02945 [Spirochaetota bacterium]